MQSEAAPKGGGREGASQWATAESIDQQQPEDSGLVQSLRFYVARTNAENRSMSESPLADDLFRYPPESRAAAAVALAADKEDRLQQLVRGYGCAVILVNLITTFIFFMALVFVIGTNAPLSPEDLPRSFALTSNIEIVPAVPATKLEEALAHPRSVVITAFDSGGFSVVYRHDVIGWEASRARSSATLFLSANRRLVVTSNGEVDICGRDAATILFEDALTGLALAEWEIWDTETDNTPHKALRDALHAAGDGLFSAPLPPGPRESDAQAPNNPTRTLEPSELTGVPVRRLSEGLWLPPTSQAGRFSPTQIPAALHSSAIMQTHQAQEYARIFGTLPYINW